MSSKILFRTQNNKKLTFITFTCPSTFRRLSGRRLENRRRHESFLYDLLLSRWWAERCGWNIVVVVSWDVCQPHQTVIGCTETICINHFNLLAFLDAQFGTALSGDVIWYDPRHLHNSSLCELDDEEKKMSLNYKIYSVLETHLHHNQMPARPKSFNCRPSTSDDINKHN